MHKLFSSCFSCWRTKCITNYTCWQVLGKLCFHSNKCAGWERDSYADRQLLTSKWVSEWKCYMLLLERRSSEGCFSLLGSADFVREHSTGPQRAKDAHTHKSLLHLCTSVLKCWRRREDWTFFHNSPAAIPCSLAHRAL